jgi:molecular chaperone HscA
MDNINKNNHVSQAFGIDLGTTNSLVAAMQEFRPVIIQFAPSLAYYGKTGETIIGNDVLDYSISDPINTVSSIKRWIGKTKQDFEKAVSSYHLNYHIAHSDIFAFSTKQGNKTPVQISADILKFLIDAANAKIKQNITKAVITVPAYFNDQQRQETKLAAEMAGIEVLRLLNEPTAAAIAYGFDNLSKGKVIVYDLGGGTLDVSLLDHNDGMLEVVAITGDNNLGGDDFDHRIYCYILEQNDICNVNAHDSALIMKQAKQVKEALSLRPQIAFNIILSTKQIINMTITELEFEKITANLLTRALLPLRQVLKDSRTKLEDIDDIILVGGSTRMPIIVRMIKNMFNKQPLNSINPDEVVAMGAALQADKLVNPKKYDWQLLDKTSISYGLETINYLVEKIIPKNTTIPISKTQIFTTAVDNQTAISIHVVQGESQVVTECCSLAKFILNGIAPQPARQPKIEVTFQIDANGILQVSARDCNSAVIRTVEIIHKIP